MNITLKQTRTNTLQYTEQEMAAKLGLSLSEYLKIEMKPLEMEPLVKLSKVVGKPIAELLDLQKQEVKLEIDEDWQAIDESLADYIKNYLAKEEIEKRLRLYREILAKREQIKEEFRRIEENKPQRIYANGCEVEKKVKRFDELKRKASVEITDGYNKIISVDNIIRLIEENKWNKVEDMKQLSAKLSNLLNDSYLSVKRKFIIEVNKEINSFLELFEKSQKQYSAENEVGIGFSFNHRIAFVGDPTSVIIFDDDSDRTTSLGSQEKEASAAKKRSGWLGIIINAGAAAFGGIPVPPDFIALIVKMTYNNFLPYEIAKNIVKSADDKGILATLVLRNNKLWEAIKETFVDSSKRLEDGFENYISELKNVVYGSDDDIRFMIASEENNIKSYDSLINNI